jgi:hypothetical protein
MLLSGPPERGAAFAFARDVVRGDDPLEPPGAGHHARRPLAAFADGPLPGLGHPGHPARPSSDPS